MVLPSSEPPAWLGQHVHHVYYNLAEESQVSTVTTIFLFVSIKNHVVIAMYRACTKQPYKNKKGIAWTLYRAQEWENKRFLRPSTQNGPYFLENTPRDIPWDTRDKTPTSSSVLVDPFFPWRAVKNSGAIDLAVPSSVVSSLSTISCVEPYPNLPLEVFL